MLLQPRALAVLIAPLLPMVALVAACGAATLPPEQIAEGTSTGAPSPDTTTGAPAGSSSGEETGAEPLPDPFELGRDNIRLLPFKVRFNKLVQLTGLPQEDPAFDVLRARRYELGDYDYASGINPDLTWSAAKISLWISAMLPVCRAPALVARFPLFPDDLDEFLTAAYGTVPSPEQLADFETLLGDANLDEPTRHASVCAAALTALEFVAR
jgi:hypothetical protein